MVFEVDKTLEEALSIIERYWYNSSPDSRVRDTIRERTTGLVNHIFPDLSRPWKENVSELQNKLQNKLQRDVANSPIPDWEGFDMRSSLKRLNPGEELNDEIINTYLGLLRKECDSSIHIASTRLLISKSPHRVDRQLMENLSKASTFIIPLHNPGHWTLAILERAEFIYSLRIYDSLTGNRSDIPSNLKKWLQNNGIKLESYEIDRTLQQNPNSNDCGLYILLIARIKVIPPTHIILSSDEVRLYMPKFRLRVLCELLAAHLDPTPSHYTEFVSGEKPCLANNQPEKSSPNQPEKPLSASIQPEKTSPIQPGKPLSASIQPEKTSPIQPGKPLSAQENIISGILSFDSEHNGLQDLSSILERAYSAGADKKFGVIKIVLPPDSEPLSHMGVTHDTYIFNLSYNSDLINAPCVVDHRSVEVVFKPERYDQFDPEDLVIAFEKGVEQGDFSDVVYVPDIEVHEDSLREKLCLPPSLLMDLPQNALSSSSKKLAGIHTPMGYLSTQKGTPFTIHIEDGKFSAISHLLYGDPKIWITIPPSDSKKLEEFLQSRSKRRGECSQFVRHLENYVPLAILKAAGINYHITLQRAGEIVFTFPNVYHQGFNLGCNFAEAVNYSVKLDLDDYRECTKLCTNGFPPIRKANLLPENPGRLSQQGRTRKRERPPGGGEEKPPKKLRVRTSFDFANISAMADRLRKAIATARMDSSQKRQSINANLKELWTRYACSSQSYYLKEIYYHERFSRKWDELLTKAKGERSADAKGKRKGKVSLMKEALGSECERSFESAIKAAQRGKIWVQLCDIFQEDFGDNRFVALCAFTESYSCLEQAENSKKDEFIKGVEGRRAEVIPILEAVLPACLFIFGHSSSLEVLSIEKTPVGPDKAAEFSKLSSSKFKRYFAPSQEN